MKLAAIAAAGAAVTGAVIAAAPAAHADRGISVVVGLTGAARGTGATFGDAGHAEATFLGGGRLTLSFDDAPLAAPPPGHARFDLRLAPELLAGVLTDDRRADGFVGAGLRGELWLASANRRFRMRSAAYTAARALAIGEHRDGAIELVIGEYLVFAHGSRFGWEGGAVIRKRNDVPAGEARELDAVVTIYVGWR